MQLLPQLIPTGLLVTVPEPVPDLEALRVYVAAFGEKMTLYPNDPSSVGLVHVIVTLSS